MLDILIRAGCMIGIMLLAMCLKKIKLFAATDFQVVSKIILNITMPSVIITSFSNYNMKFSLLPLAFLGLICNWVLSGAGFLVGKNRTLKAFNIINYAGFNIGCFLIPFAATFFGPQGIVIACMFDIGNAIMCTGLTYGVSACCANTQNTGMGKLLVRSLLSSVPFITYIVVLLMTAFNLSFPAAILEFTSIISDANIFLAMFMIGLVVEFHIKKSHIMELIKLIVIRFGICTLFALLFFFALPFPLIVRQILVLAMFSPLPISSPIFTSKIGGDESLAGTINSFCILLSVAVITILIAWMNL